jgi:mlo protein
MAGESNIKERNLEATSTWAVAVVCAVILTISCILEYLLHLLGHYLKKKNRPALYESLEKVKSELMLMGFISLLLTILQNPITGICVTVDLAKTWLPCSKQFEYYVPSDLGDNDSKSKHDRKLLEHFSSSYNPRRSLAQGYDTCADKGKLAFVTAYGIHQLHIFIFVLAVVHVLYCVLTLVFGKTKMKIWMYWENETKTIEYQYYNDPERFRFARDTSFGRRHLNFWSQSPITLWIVCFFRQFFHSVTKVDYMTLRHGFITAHLAPGSEHRFDFQKYISRSLEKDFTVVVGITPVIWFIAVLFLLTNTSGWHSYLWLPFIPLVVILLVGAKLQFIITKLGLRIQERGDVVKGAPVVQPGDDLFWFGRPSFILFLIHIVLFTNAFFLAFFIWSWYEYGVKNCFHQTTTDITIRVSMGFIVQVLCSYVTLPLYALVTQMGTTMKPTIFNDRVAAALKTWHHTARKHTKQSSHPNRSQGRTPFSSSPGTPSRGMSPTRAYASHEASPVHLLQGFNHRSAGSYQNSPRHLNVENDDWDRQSNEVSCHSGGDGDIEVIPMREPSGSTHQVPSSRVQRAKSTSDFSFGL